MQTPPRLYAKIYTRVFCESLALEHYFQIPPMLTMYVTYSKSADIGLSKQPGAEFSDDAQRQAERDLADRGNDSNESSGSERG